VKRVETKVEDKTPEISNPISRVNGMLIDRKNKVVFYNYCDVEGEVKDKFFGDVDVEESKVFEEETIRWGKQGRVGWLEIIY
jgi:hypothetical protein